MLIADVFSQDAFSAVEMTTAINLVPNTYGRLQALNLFPAEPIATTTVGIQYANGVVNLLPTKPRGAAPTLGVTARRNVRTFSIPHIPHDDYVTAADVQNRLAMSGGSLDSVEDMVARKLMAMRRKHAQTLEYLRWGALKGEVLDADGSTIVDFLTEFGVTEEAVDFDLDTAATEVSTKARDVIRHIEDHLMGDSMTGVHALCSSEFFDKLITHTNVKEAYKYYASTSEPLRTDVRRGFFYAGIFWEEHRGSATYLNADGTTTTRRFIPANDARFFPVGTSETFGTYFAPADIIGEVNVPPDTEVYAAQAIDPEFQRWVKLHTQSNPLPVVKRPAVLVRGYTG